MRSWLPPAILLLLWIAAGAAINARLHGCEKVAPETPVQPERIVSLAPNVTAMMDVSDGIVEEEETLRSRRQTATHTLEMIAERMQAPAQRMEHALTPWSTYLILPLFALANTGVALNGGDLLSGLSSPLSLGIILGLVLGKGLGLSLFSWIAVRLGIAQLPSRVSWGQLVGASSFAGIGFTMSLFISGSAFGGTALLDPAKISILFASAVAIALGMVMMRITSERRVGRSEMTELPEFQEVPVAA